jgi:hypothetical protein
MKLVAFICFFSLVSWQAGAQHFEVLDAPETYQTSFNQLLRIPIKIKNITDKAQFYIIKKLKGELSDTQKGYFCLNNHCLEPSVEEFSKKVEPGETLQDLYYILESGIQPAQSTIKFEFFPKGSPHESLIRTFNVIVEEKASRSLAFQSKEITIQDAYPNPVQEQGFIDLDYKINSESAKATVILHNILGKAMGEYELSPSETRLKINTDELVSGVYFYTIYINNSGILTRKLIIRK